MSINNIEKFKAKIARGELCIGQPITFSDPAISELIADVGYDFTWIDTEHGSFDHNTTLAHVAMLRGTDTAPFVRVPANDPILIKPVLEFVPAGIIVPFVCSAKEAETAVKACKYPPKGIRGFGPRRGYKYGGQDVPSYLKDADSRTLVIIQIEHRSAVENLDDILKVPGIDSICIGPMDLSASYGCLGQIDTPEVAKAINTTIEKVRKTDIILGVATGYNLERIRRWREQGLQWAALNIDYANLYIQSKAVLDGARSVK